MIDMMTRKLVGEATRLGQTAEGMIVKMIAETTDETTDEMIDENETDIEMIPKTDMKTTVIGRIPVQFLTYHSLNIHRPPPAKIRVDNLHYDLTEDDIYVSPIYLTHCSH